MSNGDYYIPPGDLTKDAVDAVNLILEAWQISPLNQLLSLFSGKPKFADTDAVIGAYNMSAYWPLHALASDLEIARKNGAPISDSNPAIQKQFGIWKQGTVTSIQTLAGVQTGPGGPGYWTIFALIQQSWAVSGEGEQYVLQDVKALDALTQVLSQQYAQKPPPPPSPTPPPQPPQTFPGGIIPGGTPPPVTPPTGTAGPCPPYQVLPSCLPQPGAPDQLLDEIGQGFADVAYWLQIIAIYLMNLLAAGGSGSGAGGGNPDPVTCTQLTSLVGQLAAAINHIRITIPEPSPTPEPPPPVDLTAIDTDLKNLGKTLAALENCICTALTGGAPIGADLQAKFAALVQRDVDAGLIDATEAQILFSQ